MFLSSELLKLELLYILVTNVIICLLYVMTNFLVFFTSKWLVLISVVTFYWLFTREKTVPPDVERKRKDVFVVIVGAGFSGICAAIKLKREMIRFVILEKSSQLGGTWFYNKYPGCKCDIMSHLYSYSFHLYPYWKKSFSLQKDILKYIHDVLDYYGVKEFIWFNRCVEKAVYDKETGKWEVILHDGEVLRCNFLISGGGTLHVPKFPNFPGYEDFKGQLFHASQWNQDFSLEGKSVAVIGTGATSVQVVPSIASLVRHLWVFQRTPAWVVLQPDFIYPALLKKLFEVFPFLMYLHRWYLFIRQETIFYLLFQKGFFITDILRKQITKSMQMQLHDPILKKEMIPDYELGCKRIALSNSYLPTFNRPNVTLVSNSIERFTMNGIQITGGKEIKLDAIVLATGFDLLKSYNCFEIINNEGECLSEQWANLPNAYLGIICPKFPNFFILSGPGSVLGHNSLLWMIECQMTFVVDAITKCIDKQLKSLEVKESVNKAYQVDMQNKMRRRPFSSACGSWYSNKEGTNYALWPSNLLHYWWLTLWVKLDCFKTSSYNT